MIVSQVIVGVSKVLFLGLLMKDLSIEILKQMKHSNMMPRSCDV